MKFDKFNLIKRLGELSADTLLSVQNITANVAGAYFKLSCLVLEETANPRNTNTA